MAIVRNANTLYIDATGSLTSKNIKITKLIVTSTSASAVLIIKDVTTGATKLNLEIADDATVLPLDFSDNPILFPNGIDITTVTNCVATALLQDSKA